MSISAPAGLALLYGLVIAIASALALIRGRGPANEQIGPAGRSDRLTVALAALTGVALWALLVDLRFGDPVRPGILLTPGAAVTVAADNHRWDPAGGPRERTLLALPPGLRSVTVRGFGLPAAAWDEARIVPRAHRPPPLPAGFSRLVWPETMTLGNDFELSGELPLARTVSAPATVELTIMGSVLARAPLVDGRFSLRFRPLTTGPRMVTVRGLAAGEELAREALPFVVEAPAPMAVRITLGAPSFDGRALRDWLQATGAVSGEIQTELAPGIIRTERLEADPSQKNGQNNGQNIGQSVGEAGGSGDVDLLIADGPALTDPERLAATLAAVRAGAGLILLHRGATFPPTLTAALGIAVDSLGEPTASTLAFEGERLPVRLTGTLAEPTPGTVGIRDSTAPPWRPLLRTERGAIAASLGELGAGRIALVLLEGTAAWVTSGRSEAHAAHWARLVSIVARPVSAPLILEHSELVATTGMRTMICHPGAETPEIDPAPTLPLLPAQAGAGWRCDAWWPATGGWHRINGELRFVHGGDDFWPARATARVAATGARIHPGEATGGPGLASRRTLWWLLFLASASALWLRSRLAPEGGR